MVLDCKWIYVEVSCHYDVILMCIETYFIYWLYLKFMISAVLDLYVFPRLKYIFIIMCGTNVRLKNTSA